MLEELSVGDLRRLVRVAECGSFSAAGRTLGETPRHISRRIARIEGVLDARLFHRTTRQLRATPEGEAWIQAARRSLTALEDARDALSGGPRGLVRVQVPSLLIEDFVDWCGAGLRRYPKLEIELLVGDALEDWVEAGVDLAITAPPESGERVVRRLGLLRVHLAAAPGYLDRFGAPEGPAALARHSCLRFHDRRQPQAAWPLVHEDGREVRAPLGGRFSSSDSRVLRRALRSGMGIGPATAFEMARGELRRVLPGWHLPLIELAVVMAPGRRRLARVRTVAAALQALVGEHMQPRF